MSTEAALKSPQAVGRYILYGEIASGGMATVHFGRLQGAAGFTRSVAIKRLHPQFAKDPDFVAMFVDEARLAARISHPNVVPTLDVVSQGDELLLVMEYVRGSSLSRILRTLADRGEAVPPSHAASIVSGLLRGLHAAHEAKSEAGDPLEIVHRDVSPQNVLVGTDGVTRVLDFGVAKAAGRWQSTQTGQLKGKVAYMAPEQIMSGIVTRRTDVYAASVLLWETLTGKRLFRAENEPRLIALVLDANVPLPSEVVPGLPRGFDRIVLRGLDRNPAKRFATAREMAAEVEAVIGTSPPVEVGEWVERVASSELIERASRIEEIERSIPSGPSRITRPAREGPVPARSGAIARTSPRWRWTTLATLWPPSSRLRPRAAIFVALGLASCLVGGTTVQVWRSLRSIGEVGAPSVSVSGPAPAELARVPASSIPASTVAPSSVAEAWTAIPAGTWHTLPVASGVASNGSALFPAGPAGNVAPAPPPVVAAPRAPRPASPRQASSIATPRPDCVPPYTTDAKGHVHFKPACVN